MKDDLLRYIELRRQQLRMYISEDAHLPEAVIQYHVRDNELGMISLIVRRNDFKERCELIKSELEAKE